MFRGRIHAGSGIIGVALMLSGCSLITKAPQPPAAVTIERTDPALIAVNNLLQRMSRLSQGTPAEQAEVFRAMKDAAQFAPSVQNRLGYALALATPGHGAADPEAARQQLAAMLATPEILQPSERTLAWLTLLTVEQRLVLQAENKRLREEAERVNQERAANSERRLQSQIDENAKLRKALADAQAKLDEIARIERSITERTPPK